MTDRAVRKKYLERLEERAESYRYNLTVQNILYVDTEKSILQKVKRPVSFAVCVNKELKAC